MLEGLEKAIANLQAITRLCFVGRDEEGEVVIPPNQEETREVNRLAYETWGYLLALRQVIENPKRVLDEGFNTQLFNF